MMKTIHAVLTLMAALLNTGCITTESSCEATRNPAREHDIVNQFKTPEDWEQWEKLRKHNNNALIIIEN